VFFRYDKNSLPPVLMLFSSFSSRSASTLFFLFRVLVGLLFLQHGLQKLGMLEGSVQVNGFMGFIGICELAGGLAIALGFWTRLAALLGAILMVLAYFKAHAAGGVLPIVNKGEMALLYMATFLPLIAQGAGRLSLEKLLFKRELF